MSFQAGCAMNDGIFDLTNARHLFEKLERDLQRMKANPLDTYAAFDFFVTAAHMPDWLFPGNLGEAERRNHRKDPLVAACWHLGNGAKHFELSRERHKSVDDTVIEQGAFQPDAFQPDAFDVGQITVRFSAGAATSLGAEISATELAERVLDYWRNTLTA
jgi:hypothetical protein